MPFQWLTHGDFGSHTKLIVYEPILSSAERAESGPDVGITSAQRRGQKCSRRRLLALEVLGQSPALASPALRRSALGLRHSRFCWA